MFSKHNIYTLNITFFLLQLLSYSSLNFQLVQWLGSLYLSLVPLAAEHRHPRGDTNACARSALLLMLLQVDSEEEEEMQQCSETKLSSCPFLLPLPFPLTKELKELQ